MWDFLKSLKDKVALGIVGGSDFTKIVEQLNVDKSEIFETFDYFFSENGLIGYEGSASLPAEVCILFFKLKQIIIFSQ